MLRMHACMLRVYLDQLGNISGQDRGYLTSTAPLATPHASDPAHIVTRAVSGLEVLHGYEASNVPAHAPQGATFRGKNRGPCLRGWLEELRGHDSELASRKESHCCHSD